MGEDGVMSKKHFPGRTSHLRLINQSNYLFKGKELREVIRWDGENCPAGIKRDWLYLER